MSAPGCPPLNAQRLWGRVETLAAITLRDVPWTRRAFSPLFMQAREWLRGQMEEAGLAARLDAAGNLIGRREGSDAALAPLVTGSHCDTVVGGGRFDGIIGVLAGIEVAHTLREHGSHLAHPFEVIDFLSEEPSDYGISCVGSRGMTGVLDERMLAATNAGGEALSQALRRVGGNPEVLKAPLRKRGDVAAFVELHIEQGPVLEAAGIPIGVVTNIVGIRRVLVTVTGQADHAGTTPMDVRRDALVGAARVIEETCARASAMSGNPHYVVATIGRIAMMPNVPNAVPATVEMMMEMRSESARVLDTFAEDVLVATRERLQELRVSAELKPVSRAEPTDCTPLVMDAVRASAQALGYASRDLPSGAGHDAAYLAACGPMGMIFVPCLDGRSHCAEEWIEPAQLLDGTRVLCQTLLSLDAKLAHSRAASAAQGS
jgi:beta-ureidopropionase / N-carbamoyl-L-amino-acid hydrolase